MLIKDKPISSCVDTRSACMLLNYETYKYLKCEE